MTLDCKREMIGKSWSLENRKYRAAVVSLSPKTSYHERPHRRRRSQRRSTPPSPSPCAPRKTNASGGATAGAADGSGGSESGEHERSAAGRTASFAPAPRWRRERRPSAAEGVTAVDPERVGREAVGTQVDGHGDHWAGREDNPGGRSIRRREQSVLQIPLVEGATSARRCICRTFCDAPCRPNCDLAHVIQSFMRHSNITETCRRKQQ